MHAINSKQNYGHRIVFQRHQRNTTSTQTHTHTHTLHPNLSMVLFHFVLEASLTCGIDTCKNRDTNSNHNYAHDDSNDGVNVTLSVKMKCASCCLIW